MSKVKKLFAIILTFVMVMGMTVSAFAANGTPQATDTAEVKITNLKGNPTVTLYQIAKVEYGANDQGFVQYVWTEGAKFTDSSKPTATEINAIAQDIKDGTINSFFNEPEPEKVTGTEYAKTVSAGAYIAIITGASDDTVYNPILLTAAYGKDDSNLTGGSIAANSNYLYGTTAVAKSTTPKIDKEIIEGTTPDGSDPDKDTASVGDVITYEVTPTIPDYPKNAVNKTFFISDTMSTGLDFLYNTLTIEISGQTVTKEDNQFKLGDKVIATAVQTNSGKGFNLCFDYDNLISDTATGAVYQPIITYQAVINEEAVVGNPGNPNDAELYYANDPNSGNTWTDEETKPDSAEGVAKKEDSETVYTYQLAFQKIDENGEPLAGAVFGIYKDSACTQLVDKVTTNEKGYAVSTNVASGTYYIKEISAPAGYTLNTTVYDIKATWTTATTTVTGTVTDRTYTTEEPSENAVQVGWIKDSIFYALDEFSEEAAEEGGYQKAYLDTENTTTTSATTVTENVTGGGTAMLGDEIPNIKLSELPSTGGIGTTIFTIGGCAIMILAAGLFFASRRKESK